MLQVTIIRFFKNDQRASKEAKEECTKISEEISRERRTLDKDVKIKI